MAVASDTLDTPPDPSVGADDVIPDDFDADLYLRTFPGIAEAVENGVYDSAEHHYLKHGRMENRLANPRYLALLEGRRVKAFVDLFGFSPAIGGWVLNGWTSSTWDQARVSSISLRFQNGTRSGSFIQAFYSRPALKGRGTGFVICVASIEDAQGTFEALELNLDGRELKIPVAGSVRRIDGPEIVSTIRQTLLEQPDTDVARDVLLLLSGRGFGRLPAGFNVLEGYVDWYTYHGGASGWFLSGWLSRSWDSGPIGARLLFTDGATVIADVTGGFWFREDLQARGVGFLLFVPGADNRLGGLISVEVSVGDETSFLRTVPGTKRVQGTEVVNHALQVARQVADDQTRAWLLSRLARREYTGVDTLHQLSETVLMDFDAVIACPPSGIVMIGWMFAMPGVVLAVRLRSETQTILLRLEDGVPRNRPDVLATVGAEKGFTDPRCGFVVFADGEFDANPHMYIEIETTRGEVAHRHLPAAKLTGLDAVRLILQSVDVRFADVAKAFDSTVGPAVTLLNQRRLAARQSPEHIEFGSVAPNPSYSLVIPLYRRLDFIECQMAFLLDDPKASEYEIIYVLDDPPHRREALYAFENVYNRFGIPFRVVLLPDNSGFPPACNAGLEVANGRYVCFLNSDVFSGTVGWLDRLSGRLDADPELGVVGPLLLYGDETVQHEGMTFKKLVEFGSWHFGDHFRKGHKRSAATGLRKHISITGACMMLRTDQARELGGFDESYIIGDFEDSDLCLRLGQRGLYTAVDLDVHLYHLERKSQAGSGENWRMSLTLYNAWLHERRWGRVIDEHKLLAAGEPVAATETLA